MLHNIIKVCISFLFLGIFIIPAHAKSSKRCAPITVRAQISSIRLKLIEGDWKDRKINRHFVPQLQVQWNRCSLKGRFFSFGAYRQGMDEGQMNGHFRNNGVMFRTFTTVDIIASFALLNKPNHHIFLGAGGTHRSGTDYINDHKPLSVVPDVYFGHYERIRDCGVAAEASYAFSFLKFGIVSVDFCYRVYPDVPNLFTVGLGYGLQYKSASFMLSKQ